MTFDNLTKIFLSASSITIGAILGILRSKIFALKSANPLYYFFYGFALIVLVGACICTFLYRDAMFNPTNWFGIIVLTIAIVSSFGLFLFSNRFLVFKNVYDAIKLDPIVNRFTSAADRNEIKLFGGDLNFFGNEPSQMDINSQYSHLKSMGFTKVSMLCETPDNIAKQIRYGKILNELNGCELKFYDPEQADLKVRGRIIKVNGVNRLLMYNRVRSKVYQAIETDLANSNGALYSNIWDLTWSLAIKPTEEQKISWVNLYKKPN